MKKRIISVLLSCALITTMLWGCGSSGQDTQETGKAKAAQEEEAAAEPGFVPGEFPISQEPITIKIMVPITASHSKSLGELDFLKEYEEKTNVHIEWEEVSSEAYAEKYKLTLASGDLPDAFGSGFSYDPSLIYKYAKEGLIVPLDDYIESSTVNIKKVDGPDMMSSENYPHIPMDIFMHCHPSMKIRI